MSSKDDLAAAWHLGYSIKRAQHALRIRMDDGLRVLGLTTPQYSAMSAVAARPGISNAELARSAFVTPQTMQAILAGLEREGLLERVPDPSHGRILRSGLTAKGSALLAEAHRLMDDVGEILVQAIGATDAVRLTKALGSVADALSKAD